MANNWTRDELIIAFNLYCKIPFSKSVKSNPDVINVANLIGRTPSAVAFKLGNFGSLDPELKKRGVGGLPNISKLDKQIWDEFNENWEDLAFQSELLVARVKNDPIGTLPELSDLDFPTGLDRERQVKTRVNQQFFRSAILSIYNSTCCITGLQVPEMLIASHIIPWSESEITRTNPQNGLCLNALHDKAFDTGFITITMDYKVKVSNKLIENYQKNAVSEYFLKYDNKSINLPDKFLPKLEFLNHHFESKFRK